MKKLLVVGVIVLFLGLACAPSINANISKESELVAITTEICGLGGGKQTVQLTQKEAEEVEQFIDDLERRLDEVETREEAEEIFNEALVELDKYGLLGGLSIKQAQKLVLGPYQNVKFVKLLDNIYAVNSESNDKLKNFFCLTLGQFDEYYCWVHGSIGRICYSLASRMFIHFLTNSIIFNIAGWMYENDFEQFGDLLVTIIAIILTPFAYTLLYSYYTLFLMAKYYPILIGTIVYLGRWDGGIFNESSPSEGNLSTFGLLGRKSKTGFFYGNLPIFPVYIPIFEIKHYPGILGFSGLKIFNNDSNPPLTLIGFSLWINVKSEPP